jgi:cytochrome P450
MQHIRRRAARPVGGGIRRCIGATFAHMEMDVVLRVLLERTELLSTDAPDEPWAIRGIVLAAGQGGRAAVRRVSPRKLTPQPA